MNTSDQPSADLIRELNRASLLQLAGGLTRYVREACLGNADAARALSFALTQGMSETEAARYKTLAQRTVDLADIGPPDPAPLLFGSYFLKGHAHWLTAPTGLGKSTFAYNLATALAEGVPIWDIDCPQTRVLYVDTESGDGGRALKIDRLYGETARVRGQLLFLREALRLPDELPDLLAFVAEHTVGFVIFDTARRCFSVKDENDNAEVYNRIVPTLDALKAAGVATLTMGHPAKHGNGSARGAGAQEDAGDVNLSLTMHRGETADADGVLALRVTKNRLLGLGIPPLYLRRAGGDRFERVEAGEVDTIPVTTRRGRCRDTLLEFLGAALSYSARHGELYKAALEAGFTKPTFDRVLREMKEGGDLYCATIGVYTLPDPYADLEDADAEDF